MAVEWATKSWVRVLRSCDAIPRPPRGRRSQPQQLGRIRNPRADPAQNDEASSRVTTYRRRKAGAFNGRCCGRATTKQGNVSTGKLRGGRCVALAPRRRDQQVECRV